MFKKILAIVYLLMFSMTVFPKDAKSSSLMAGLKCTQVAKVHQYSDKKYGAVLSDIINHSNRVEWNQEQSTTAHETTHEINSIVRNAHPVPGAIETNAFYVGDGCAIVIAEPKHTKKSYVAKYVPPTLRGNRFSLYLLGQSSFENEPLYILDEFTAYINGGEAAVDLHQRGLWAKGNSLDAVAGTVEFIPYALGLAQAVQKYDPEYFSKEKQFLELIRFNIERGMIAFNKGHVIPEFQGFGQDELLNRIQTSPDAEGMRQFARATFGADWTKRVLGF